MESIGKPNNSDSPEEDVSTVLIGPDTNEATLGPKSANDSTATSSESIGSDSAGIAEKGNLSSLYFNILQRTLTWKNEELIRRVVRLDPKLIINKNKSNYLSVNKENYNNQVFFNVFCHEVIAYLKENNLDSTDFFEIKFTLDSSKSDDEDSELTLDSELAVSLPLLMIMFAQEGHIGGLVKENLKILEKLLEETTDLYFNKREVLSKIYMSGNYIFNSQQTFKTMQEVIIYNILLLPSIISYIKENNITSIIKNYIKGLISKDKTFLRLDLLTYSGVEIQEILKDNDLKLLLYNKLKSDCEDTTWLQTIEKYTNIVGIISHIALSNKDEELTKKIIMSAKGFFFEYGIFPVPINAYANLSNILQYCLFEYAAKFNSQTNQQFNIYIPKFKFGNPDNSIAMIDILTMQILMRNKESIKQCLEYNSNIKDSLIALSCRTKNPVTHKILPSFLTQYKIKITDLVELGISADLLVKNENIQSSIAYIYEKESDSQGSLDRLKEIINLGVSLQLVLDYVMQSFSEKKVCNDLEIHIFIEYIHYNKKGAEGRLKEVLQKGVDAQKLYDFSVKEHFNYLSFDHIEPLLSIYHEHKVVLDKPDYFLEKDDLRCYLFFMDGSPAKGGVTIDEPLLERFLGYGISIDSLYLNLVSEGKTPDEFISLIPLFKAKNVSLNLLNRKSFVFLAPFINESLQQFEIEKFIELSPQLVDHGFNFEIKQKGVAYCNFDVLDILFFNAKLDEIQLYEQLLDIWKPVIEKKIHFFLAYEALRYFLKSMHSEKIKDFTGKESYFNKVSALMQSGINAIEEVERKVSFEDEEEREKFKVSKPYFKEKVVPFIFNKTHLDEYQPLLKTENEKEIQNQDFKQASLNFGADIPTHDQLGITEKEFDELDKRLQITIKEVYKEQTKVHGLEPGSKEFKQFYKDLQGILNVLLHQGYNEDGSLDPVKTLEILKCFSNNFKGCMGGKLGQFTQDLRLMKQQELTLESSISNHLALMRIELFKEELRRWNKRIGNSNQIHVENLVLQIKELANCLKVPLQGDSGPTDKLAAFIPNMQKMIIQILKKTMNNYTHSTFEITNLVDSLIKDSPKSEQLFHHSNVADWMKENLVNDWKKSEFDELINNKKMWEEIKEIAHPSLESKEFKEVVKNHSKEEKILDLLKMCLKTEDLQIIYQKDEKILMRVIKDYLSNKDNASNSLYKELDRLAETCRKANFLTHEVYNQEFNIRLDRILEMLEKLGVIQKGFITSQFLSNSREFNMPKEIYELFEMCQEYIKRYYKVIKPSISL